MPTRIQALTFGLGLNKQTDISTIAGSPTFMRLRKLNMDIASIDYLTENDAAEIGKGNEFISEVFPLTQDLQFSIEKFGSAEFISWAWAYALGDVTFGTGTYTIKPIDPGVTLELPYFPVVQQLNEGGSSAVDEMFVGCAVEEVQTVCNYGPGRQSVKTTASVIGSGRLTTPSLITLPGTPLAEHYMVSSSLALTVNGVDYVSSKQILSGVMGWKNNLLTQAGYFPGSGTQNSASVRGRLEIGARVPTFNFVIRLLRGSTELAALLAQTTGTAVLTLTYDSTHTVTWTWEKVSYQAVKRGEADGIVTFNLSLAPQYDSTNGILAISAKNGLTALAG